jgi:hypothetical protein
LWRYVQAFATAVGLTGLLGPDQGRNGIAPYQAQSAPNMGDGNGATNDVLSLNAINAFGLWSIIPDPPLLVNGQDVLTNTTLGNARFYQLGSF